MHIAVLSSSQSTNINELAPVLVYALGFVLAIGGVYAVSIATCGWGRVHIASVDFWRAQVRIQCK